MPEQYDCIVIGSGPGGYVAAIRAAQLGMKTAVVEKDKVGGRCLNYACIPAKAVLRVADILSEIDEADEFGIEVPSREVDFSKVSARREKVVKTLTGGVGGLLKKNKIDVIEGEASLADGGVKVGDETYQASKAIILATGSVPKPVPGTQFGGRVIGTEEGWALEKLPKKIAVLGAGASGSELASAYARLGTEVLLFEMLDRVLPTEDADISKVAGRQLQKQGIKINLGVPVENVQSHDDKVTFTYGDNSDEVEYLIIAAGRGPDVEALGLDKAGIKLTDRGLIEVDGALRTSVEKIYAIGDLVPGPALAHKASDEGVIAVEDAAGMKTHPIEYVDIPRATFCTPNVASFGLTEAQARDAGMDVVVGKLQYGAVGAGTVYGDRTGVIKIIGDKKYGELVGGHIVGAKATELIQELVNAKALEGGYAEVARIIHGHPTLSEGVMEAARAADGWLIHG
ncbi:dihydrolipoyl dehydrogenase [Solirubrobacter sp. CPCC 204708]|uniref:Dihydrolipoyl dehydrogenase n=1 Tax=Solirubrobacter deserti TaxID=2282478 RepID=A0ABT4RKC2_9ACTN|nr:dihydrolipoyl dehydrogenase [Solirubrobacter deserti]MBE2316821.1 dihydrolipoyl dehydrogenase [Solirubrobacter deserti]MDA0138962.1 dihydrolipoyl dehydrogenase [Solirubrobacter deserti]